MFNNDRLNRIFDMYEKGLITKNKAEDQAYSVPDLENEELAKFLNGLDNVNVKVKEETWEEKQQKDIEKNRMEAEATRQRQAERDQKRLEEEAKKREEEEKQKKQEEKDNAFEEKIEFLSNLKDENDNLKYNNIKAIYEKIDKKDYTDVYGFEDFINTAYENEQRKIESANAIRESQERYNNSMTPEERQEGSISRYGINSEQGKKAKETYDRIKKEIQQDNYKKLIEEDEKIKEKPSTTSDQGKTTKIEEIYKEKVKDLEGLNDPKINEILHNMSNQENNDGISNENLKKIDELYKEKFPEKHEKYEQELKEIGVFIEKPEEEKPEFAENDFDSKGKSDDNEPQKTNEQPAQGRLTEEEMAAFINKKDGYTEKELNLVRNTLGLDETIQLTDEQIKGAQAALTPNPDSLKKKVVRAISNAPQGLMEIIKGNKIGTAGIAISAALLVGMAVFGLPAGAGYAAAVGFAATAGHEIYKGRKL